jgi:hypothetical protein
MLHTTKGHPSRWNDKTLQLCDDLMKDVQKGKGIAADSIFSLFETDADGNIVSVKHKGAWLLVDNGCLHWPTTMPPFKRTTHQAETRWSKWLESMRKDVECTFGMLKGRFRILKTGIRTQGDSADKTWMTCCALHNRLLDVDGLDEQWNSDWASDSVDEELAEEDDNAMPISLRRLFGNLSPRQHEERVDAVLQSVMTEMSAGADEPDVNAPMPPPNNNPNREPGYRHVSDLSFECFRGRLVHHFDVIFHRGKEINRSIAWPAHKKKQN